MANNIEEELPLQHRSQWVRHTHPLNHRGEILIAHSILRRKFSSLTQNKGTHILLIYHQSLADDEKLERAKFGQNKYIYFA